MKVTEDPGLLAFPANYLVIEHLNLQLVIINRTQRLMYRNFVNLIAGFLLFFIDE